MSGPIVRTGTNPKFWSNWDRAFGKGAAEAVPAKKAAAKKTAKAAAPKAAKKAAKKATKKTAKKAK